MKIRWLGHSSFLLTASNGGRVVTDPYDGTIGYTLPDVEADIVTTSHGHFDHNYTKGVKGSFIHLDKPGRYNIKGIDIHGIPSFHDENQGRKRGTNILFTFAMDGITICHCGDFGHLPDTGMLREMGKVDILLIPVGGTFTLDAEGAATVVKAVKPSVTIPMHYKTEVLTFSIDGVDKFLNASEIKEKNSVMAGKNEIEVNTGNINRFPPIVLLEYQ